MKITDKTKINEFISEFGIKGANVDNCILHTTFTTQMLIEIISEKWIYLHYAWTKPFFRNIGNFRMILYNIINEYPEYSFYCLVKKDNIASNIVFDRFKFERQDYNESFFIYQLKR